MGKFSENNHENYKAWDPAPEFIGMYDLVSETSDNEGCGRNDYDTPIAREAVIDRVEKLCSNYNIYRRPA